MQQRTLGTDLPVSASGLGCMSMTGRRAGQGDLHDRAASTFP